MVGLNHVLELKSRIFQAILSFYSLSWTWHISILYRFIRYVVLCNLVFFALFALFALFSVEPIARPLAYLLVHSPDETLDELTIKPFALSTTRIPVLSVFED